MNIQTPSCPICKTKFEVRGEDFNSQAKCPKCAHAFKPMSELVKESMKWFENKVKEETDMVTHEQFVAGCRDGTMKATPYKGNAYFLIQGERRKKIFSFLVLLYLCGPLILIPFWSWQQGNSKLFYGIIISWISTFVTKKLVKQKWQNSFCTWLLVFTLLAWVMLGNQSYYTVFLTLSFFGCFSYILCEGVMYIFIQKSLLENASFFKQAVTEQRIWIVKKTK